MTMAQWTGGAALLAILWFGCNSDEAQSRDGGPDPGGACPASAPAEGSPCNGALRCSSGRHGDCNPPPCPVGCKFAGNSRGVYWDYVCVGGVWTVEAVGHCYDPKDAICDCPDASDMSDGS
jgi:hypothetical protein